MVRSLLLVPALLLSNCSDASKPSFADLQFKVRCRLSGGDCVESLVRDVQNLHGEDGHVVTCSLSDQGDGAHSLSFSVQNTTDDWGLTARNVGFSTEGGSVIGATADFTLTEGANTYEGNISANPTDLGECPDPEDRTCSRCTGVTHQCRLSSLTFVDEPEGEGIQGQLLCLCLPNRADQLITREVTGAGAFDDDDPLSADPVSFRLLNCDG